MKETNDFKKRVDKDLKKNIINDYSYEKGKTEMNEEKNFKIAPSGAKIPNKDWERYKKACRTISTLILAEDIHSSHNLQLYPNTVKGLAEFLEGLNLPDSINADSAKYIGGEEVIKAICQIIFKQNQEKKIPQWKFLSLIDDYFRNETLYETLPKEIKDYFNSKEGQEKIVRVCKKLNLNIEAFNYIFGIYIKERVKRSGYLIQDIELLSLKS